MKAVNVKASREIQRSIWKECEGEERAQTVGVRRRKSKSILKCTNSKTNQVSNNDLLTAALANIAGRLGRGAAGNKPQLHLAGRSQQENAKYLSSKQKITIYS